MTELNPAEIAHRHRESDWPGLCSDCCDNMGGMVAWPCEPYRLAEALVAEQAKVARVTAIVDAADADRWNSLRRMFSGEPFPASLGTAEIRTALSDWPE